jgi:ABC-type transport system involved in multi-copper enzyme maturation permease subunit
MRGDATDAAPAPKRVAVRHWLPYWAVFQADVRLTLQSWVYRSWVLASLLATVGYLLYRYAPYHEAGLTHPASGFLSDLLRWTALGSAALVAVLTAGSIASERGTLADSVLSRGISRYQYFLGKWHARLAAVLATYVVLAAVALAASLLFLQEDLSLQGSLAALGAVGAMLMAVISCGVAVSALTRNTLAGVAVLLLALYGGGFALSLLPANFPAPDRVLHSLPDILRGHYHLAALGRLAGWSAGLSGAAALVGLAYFGRRDV